MNQGKLEVVKQEMARVNVDILGISELQWSGIVDLSLGFLFCSIDLYFCLCASTILS